MVAILLILRPQPGADASAARAREMGLEPVIAPLFTLQPLDWEPPDPADIDAVFLTSANAARAAGPARAAFVDLPCYAVGEATAAAAKEAGFSNVRPGPGDVAALLDLAAASGVRSPLHLCGRDHIEVEHPQLKLIRRIVYAAEPVPDLPGQAHEAIERGAIVLLHSPRAASTFAGLIDAAGLARSYIPIAAISAAALAAAGAGWKLGDYARTPRDEALLELAAKLCKTWPKRDRGPRQ